MDFTESSKSQWFGRYSWGDENQLNEALKLNGFQVLTNVEQYMGSNVRVFSSVDGERVPVSDTRGSSTRPAASWLSFATS